MTKQVIAFSTTPVAPSKTAAEIEEMLARHGVSKTAKKYDKGRVVAVYFEMDTPQGRFPFSLPVNVDAVYQLFLEARRSIPAYRHRSLPKEVEVKMFLQAERTAWRIVHWWVKAQLALVQTQMVTVTEIFLPYMLVGGGQTLYQRLASGDLTILAALRPGVEAGQ